MVVMAEVIGKNKIKKVIVKQGSGKKPASENGAKATFHFRTIDPAAEKEDSKVIDDSRHFEKPFELLYGKSFKLPCWEECVQTMLIGEVARFSCPVKCVIDYPTISRSLRDLYHGHDHSTHTCGLHAMEKGLGYEDLNELAKNIKPLDFEFELLKVEGLDCYEKELWQMNEAEMLESVPKFHEEGNKLFKDSKVADAERKYANALGCLKHLQIKERPGTEVWVDLDQKQIPLLLNYAQCKLNLENYAECITHCTEVLEKIDGAENVKALFKRGKAFACLLDEKECRRDFDQALKIDPSIKPAIEKELKMLDARQKKRDAELSKNLKGKMFG